MFTTELKYVLVRYMLNELGDEAANVGLVAVTDDPRQVITRASERDLRGQEHCRRREGLGREGHSLGASVREPARTQRRIGAREHRALRAYE